MQVLCLTIIQEDEDDKRFVQLACNADGVASPDPVNQAIAAIAETRRLRLNQLHKTARVPKTFH